MDTLMVLGSVLTLSSGLGLALSVGSHRSKSVALPSIALGSIALLSFLALALYMALDGRIVEISVLRLEMGCDYVSLLIVLNIVVLGIASLVASYGYCQIVDEYGYGPYYTLLLVFALSMALIPLVRNWLWFLLAFEIMTLASYFLVGYEYRDRRVARIAWMYFITMHIFCTLPLIVAVGMVYGYANTLSFVKARIPDVALALFLLGFAAKSGLFPLHFWLPDAHPVAPTPVSALLSGAMVEIGVYGMYRVLELYGPAPPWITNLMIVLAVLSTLIAVASYPRQSDVKKLFAWSTIDNVGWMYLCLALGFGGSTLATYILNHGLAKAAAFLSAGLMLYVFGTRDLRKLSGCFAIDRFATTLMVLSIFALEGVPPFNFFWSRIDVVSRALNTSPFIGILYVVLWTLAFVSFLNVVHKLIEVKRGEEQVSKVRNVSLSIVFSVLILLALLLVSNYLCESMRLAMGVRP